MDKKAQAEVLLNWFIAIAVIFLIVLFSMIWLGNPWQKVDSSISPMIDNTYCGEDTCADDLPPQFRRNQGLVPVIIIIAVLLIAFLSGIRRDPNVPYGPY